MPDSELPWPSKGDALFTSDGGWNTACLGWSANQWYGYTEGYRRAAEILVQHVIECGREHDKLVYPIVFSSRHYLEIKLKFLLLSASRLVDREASISSNHSLMHTWRALRPLLGEIFAGHDQGELDAVEAVLSEFDSRDGSSMAFRYPIDTRGESLQPTSSTIALQRFGKTMDGISAFLEACDTAIQQYADAEQEMLALHWYGGDR